MKPPVKLDIDQGGEWLLPAAKRWLAEAKRLTKLPFGSKVFPLPSGEKVTVNWRQGADYIRISAPSTPYCSLGAVDTPYDIDGLYLENVYDYYATATWEPLWNLPDTCGDIAYTVLDVGTGAQYSSGVVNSCADPFWTNQIGEIVTSKNCSGTHTAVVSSLHGVVSRAYGFIDGVWLGGDTADVSPACLPGSPATIPVPVPDRVAFYAAPTSGGGAEENMQARRRVIAANDWNRLREDMINGVSPPAQFVRQAVPGVVSTRAKRQYPITVTVNTDEVSFSSSYVFYCPDSVSPTLPYASYRPEVVTITRKVDYQYQLQAPGESEPQTVVGALIGTRTIYAEQIGRYLHNRRAVTNDFLSGVLAYSDSKIMVANACSSDYFTEYNKHAAAPAKFLRDYWAAVPLVESTTYVFPQQYEARQNTPGVRASVVLFSRVVDGAPTGPLNVFTWPATVQTSQAPNIAIHGVMYAKYDSDAGEFVFSRWEDLGDYEIAVPAGVSISSNTTAFRRYYGYPWIDIVSAAETHKTSTTFTFLQEALRAARAAKAEQAATNG